MDYTFRTYDSHAELYLSKFSTIGVRAKDIDETFSYIHKENPTVLELGCAGGRDASHILTKTNTYTGIDYVPAFIDRAQKENPSGTFVCAKMQDFSFPENTDVIFAFASLLHLSKEELADIFAKAYRALSPSGLFRISLKASNNYKEELVLDQYGERLFFSTMRKHFSLQLLPTKLYSYVEKSTRAFCGSRVFSRKKANISVKAGAARRVAPAFNFSFSPTNSPHLRHHHLRQMTHPHHFLTTKHLMRLVTKLFENLKD